MLRQLILILFLITATAKAVKADVGWTGPIPEKWTVEKCSSAQVKGAEGNEEKSVQ
jgi:hypothetical protein